MMSPTGRGSGGAVEHDVTMYGLSTCVWCRKMRQFLEGEGVVFTVVYVDKLEGGERDAALREVRRWNPAASFPILVIDGETSVNGYRPDEAKEVLGL